MAECCVCVCVNVTLLLTFPSNNFSQEQVAAPVYKDGDFWVFRVTQSNRIGMDTARLEGDYQISYASGEAKFLELTGSEKIEMTQNINELQGMLGIDQKDKIFQYLQFPLVVGQKWTREYQYRGYSGTKTVVRRRTASQSVVGIEQITTPAGTFRTFKIESEPIGAGEGGEVWILRYHYSPETKSIVKFLMTRSGLRGEDRGKTEIELIRFGTAP